VPALSRLRATVADVTPLSDALTTAQRFDALENEYAAGSIDAGVFVARLAALGLGPVDCSYVRASMDVMLSWDVAEPHIAARVAAERTTEP